MLYSVLMFFAICLIVWAAATTVVCGWLFLSNGFRYAWRGVVWLDARAKKRYGWGIFLLAVTLPWCLFLRTLAGIRWLKRKWDDRHKAAAAPVVVAPALVAPVPVAPVPVAAEPEPVAPEPAPTKRATRRVSAKAPTAGRKKRAPRGTVVQEPVDVSATVVVTAEPVPPAAVTVQAPSPDPMAALVANVAAAGQEYSALARRLRIPRDKRNRQHNRNGTPVT